MKFIKDRANVCKTCACDDRLNAERVLFHFFGFRMIIQKNPLKQVASCEPALIKTNSQETDSKLPEQNSAVPMFVESEFGAFEIFMENDGFAKTNCHISPTGNVKNISYSDRI